MSTEDTPKDGGTKPTRVIVGISSFDIKTQCPPPPLPDVGANGHPSDFAVRHHDIDDEDFDFGV
jgi:hypothetical protein